MEDVLASLFWYRKFLRLSEFAGGKSRKRAKLVFLYSIRCEKEHFISCKGRLYKMFSCVRLRHMDFLKYSGKCMETDITALYSPSGRTSVFLGRPCPEITGDLTEY